MFSLKKYRGYSCKEEKRVAHVKIVEEIVLALFCLLRDGVGTKKKKDLFQRRRRGQKGCYKTRIFSI